MLTVRDGQRDLHASIHGSYLDYVVAALSADPETIEELQAALARFLPEEREREFFAGRRGGTCPEPWDAGVAIIDLAARLMVIESSYSRPGPHGGVAMTDARNAREVVVPYHVADDWLFTWELESWEALADERRRARRATSSLDARAVLYGQVCAFIAQACWSEARTGAATVDKAAVYQVISAIHARWLMAPRPDLGGQTPRDVLLARNSHLSWDIQDRAQQWSLLGACPRGLSTEAAAYHHGGFGTHEIVLYYSLVRFLLNECWEHAASQGNGLGEPSTSAEDFLAAEIHRLEALRDQWLETPDFEDLHGRTPASVIARERARLPEAVSGAEAMIDHDCPLCQMMADEPSPMFWHLDGCNMDDDFAFSFHRTREEWEAERRDWEDFDRRFEEEQRSKIANAAELGDSVWQTSFSADTMGTSVELSLFGLGAHLAELIQDLKDTGAATVIIDGLNREFGNLRDSAQDPAATLVEAVIEKMRDTLATVGATYSALGDKCADLERQLSAFARRLVDPPWDEELPF